MELFTRTATRYFQEGLVPTEIARHTEARGITQLEGWLEQKIIDAVSCTEDQRESARN